MCNIIFILLATKPAPLFSIGDIIALIGAIVIPLLILGLTNRKSALEAIRASIRKIELYLASRDTSAMELFSGVASPITLNNIGEEILNNSGGKIYIDNNIEHLIQKIRNLNPKSELDVENFSKRVLLDKFDTDDFISIRNFMYNTPIHKKVTLNQATIITIIGIYLRSKYLEKYPGLNI